MCSILKILCFFVQNTNVLAEDVPWSVVAGLDDTPLNRPAHNLVFLEAIVSTWTLTRGHFILKFLKNNNEASCY